MSGLLDMVPAPPGWTVDWAGLDEAFAWIRAMRGCPQSPVYHAEGDVWIHTRMVCEALAALPSWRTLADGDRAAIFLGALLHDVGKPSTTRTEPDGTITSRGHSRRGAIDARVLLWRLGIPVALRERICALVLHHQEPFFLIERDDGERRALTIAERARCDHLALVTEADGRGRRCADQESILDNVALFREHCRELGCLERPYPFASDHSRFLYFRTPGRHPGYHAHDDTRSEVTVMSGLPAAGKDHWIAEHAPHLPVVSLDALRAELGISPAKNQGKVVAAARERARVHLRAGEPFVWNGTNISRQLRSRVLSLLADYGARVRIVAVETSEHSLRDRNRRRREPVPDRALDAMLARWEVPDTTEAHEVVVIHNP